MGINSLPSEFCNKYSIDQSVFVITSFTKFPSPTVNVPLCFMSKSNFSRSVFSRVNFSKNTLFLHQILVIYKIYNVQFKPLLFRYLYYFFQVSFSLTQYLQPSEFLIKRDLKKKIYHIMLCDFSHF